MQVLQLTHPSLYVRFVQGFFIVRDCQHTHFSLVARNSKLEQSVNKFLKVQGGYVCVSTYGDVSAVAEFELPFHEMLKIANHFNHIIGNKYIWHIETSIKHSFRGSKMIKVQLFDVVNGKG